MAFVETTALISELWSSGPTSFAAKSARISNTPGFSSGLVLREFHERITSTLIRIHLLLGMTHDESHILNEFASDRYKGAICVQVIAAIKQRLGISWDAVKFRQYIEVLLQGEITKELASVLDGHTNLTGCHVYNRRIEKTPDGHYFLDVGCQKRKCACSSPLLLSRRLDAAALQRLKASKNADVEKMVPILETFLAGDKAAVQGRTCNVVSDLVHVIEAAESSHSKIITSDKAYPDLSDAVYGPEIVPFKVSRLSSGKSKAPKPKTKLPPPKN